MLYGDAPCRCRQHSRLLEARRAAGAAVAVLGMHPPDPAGYGRLAFEGRDSTAIVEERHADDALRQDGRATPVSWRSMPPGSGPLLDALELRTPRTSTT